MININKDKFFMQVNNMNLYAMNLSLDDFNTLYMAAAGELNDINPDTVKSIIDKVIKGIFNLNFALNELVVPLNFLDTEIGKAILKIRFGLNTGTYLIPDLVKLTGYSTQYISQEAKKGNIKGEQRGKIWLFTADNVEEYMIRKGLWKAKTYYPNHKESIIVPEDREAEYVLHRDK